MSAQTTQSNELPASRQREESIMASTLSPVRPGAKGAPAEAEGAEGKKKGKKKILIILLVLLLVGGGAGYKLTKKPAGPAKPQPGAVLPLDSISLNLAEN